MKKNKESARKNFLEDVLKENEATFNNLATEINVNADRDLCPFIQNPHEDCYCACIDSTKVIPLLYYCGGNFKNCEIYRRLK